MNDLEALVTQINKAGQEWVEAKLKSDQLEADEKNYLAALINELEKAFDKVSETRLERLARGSAEFRAYVTGRIIAQAETNRKKVRYEAAQNLFEAKRSLMALEREKIAKAIYHTGS
jgi:hypothetical protein